MPLSLQALLTPTSEDDALTGILQILQSVGFPATSWQSGSIARTLVQMVARLYADFSTTRLQIAAAGFNELATGDWLDLLSTSFYDNTRNPAVATQGTIRLYSRGGAGPFTVTVGQYVISAGGQTYRNITAGTVAVNDSAAFTWQAEVAGSAGNLADLTPCTLTNGPAGLDTAGSLQSAWLTRSGADAETDAQLRERNRTKWATLSPAGGPKDAYVNWARSADPSIKRVQVDDQNPDGPGTVTVWVAGDDGGSALADAAVDAVKSAIGTAATVNVAAVDGLHPLGAVVTVKKAVDVGFSPAFTIYTTTAYVGGSVATAIDTWLKTLPVGGVITTDPNTGVVPFGQMYQIIMAVPGVLNASNFTSPTTDFPIAKGRVAVNGGVTITRINV